jgi:hypothetical protein
MCYQLRFFSGPSFHVLFLHFQQFLLYFTGSDGLKSHFLGQMNVSDLKIPVWMLYENNFTQLGNKNMKIIVWFYSCSKLLSVTYSFVTGNGRLFSKAPTTVSQSFSVTTVLRIFWNILAETFPCSLLTAHRLGGKTYKWECKKWIFINILQPVMRLSSPQQVPCRFRFYVSKEISSNRFEP